MALRLDKAVGRFTTMTIIPRELIFSISPFQSSYHVSDNSKLHSSKSLQSELPLLGDNLTDLSSDCIIGNFCKLVASYDKRNGIGRHL